MCDITNNRYNSDISFCIFSCCKGEPPLPNIFYGFALFVIFPLQRSWSYLYLITFLRRDLLIVSNKNMISGYLLNKTQYNSPQFNCFSSKWRTIKNLNSSAQTQWHQIALHFHKKKGRNQWKGRDRCYLKHNISFLKFVRVSKSLAYIKSKVMNTLLWKHTEIQLDFVKDEEYKYTCT